MKILRQFTIRCLRLNRARTLVTFIGIVLSVALLTAVTEGAYSGHRYLLDYMCAYNGTYHICYEDIDTQQLQALQEDGELTSLATWEEIGYAEIPDEATRSLHFDQRPYLYLVSASDNLPQLLPVKLLAGRAAQTPEELVLPESLSESTGGPYALGDTLTLRIGTRTVNGERLGQHNPYLEGEETLQNVREMRCTVVGFCARLPYEVEDYSAPGYVALTAGEGTGLHTVFFTLAHPRLSSRYLENASCAAYANSEVLNLIGGGKNPYLLRSLYGLMAVLLALIVFGSVALIYNAFSISVSERTRQIGLLSSIGATRRQVRASVLFEAVYLCVIAVPLGLLVGCGGIGATLYLLRGTFEAAFASQGAPIRLVLTPWALIAPAVIGFLTALLSAWIPAQRTARLTCIEAIRQTKDVQMRGAQRKTSRLARRFGFEATLAARNFKRDKKKYRATVLSLFLSVVLFVSSWAFSSYLLGSAEITESAAPYDVCCSLYGHKSEREARQMLTRLSALDGVLDAAWRESYNGPLAFAQDNLSAQYREVFSTQRPNAYFCFVQDDLFAQLLAQEGLDAAQFCDPAHPAALAYDNNRQWLNDGNGLTAVPYQVLDAGRLPVTADLVYVNVPDGYNLYSSEEAENGERTYTFLSQTDGSEMTLPVEDVETTAPVTIGAVVDELPFYAENRFTLIYPYSLAGAVLQDDAREPIVDFVFRTDDSARLSAELDRTLQQMNLSYDVYDTGAAARGDRAITTVVRVFSTGFVVLIFLIAAANVFNTICTNIVLRRRELAMLRSVGMTQAGFRRSMNYECLLYGCKALAFGLPVSIGLCWLIYRTIAFVRFRFTLPWLAIGLAVAGVFTVVFASMLYAMRRIRDDNPIDALRTETL